MLYLDFEANTEKEATQLALESLGLDIEDVTIEPITEGKKSFFGLGKKEKAKIRVYYKEKSEINDIIYTVRTLINKLDKNSLVEVESAPDSRYIIKVESTEPGKLIGKNGRAIEAIQTVVNGILQRHENRYKVVVDVDNYNERQMKRLVMEAQKAAREVQKSRRSITLEAMNPFQRRLIHMELQKMRGISTKSNGDGKYKTVTINYSGGGAGAQADSGNTRRPSAGRYRGRGRGRYNNNNNRDQQNQGDHNYNKSDRPQAEIPDNLGNEASRDDAQYVTPMKNESAPGNGATHSSEQTES